MSSAVEIRRRQVGRHLCYSLLVFDDSVLKFARCPVDNDCLRVSRAKQVNGVPDGRHRHKSTQAVFGTPEIKCVGETALAIFSAISLMVNTPRL
jgi:hypothetical protein